MDHLTQLLQDMGVTSTRDEPIVTSTRDMPVGIDAMPEDEPTSILNLGDNMDIIINMLFGSNAGGGQSSIVTLMRAHERARNNIEFINTNIDLARQGAQATNVDAIRARYMSSLQGMEQSRARQQTQQDQISSEIEDYVNFFNMLRIRNHLPTLPANVIRNTLQRINPRRRTQ